MKRVAIKFCGGCDPVYERVTFWEKVRSAAADRIEWVSVNDYHFKTLLLIAGCPRACPERELKNLSSGKIISVKNAEIDPLLLIDMLLSECKE